MKLNLKLLSFRSLFNTAKRCIPLPGELLLNSSFNCGLLGWDFDVLYPATLTDNGDGSVTLQSTSKYGSVVPAHPVFPRDSYRVTCVMTNVVGTGKISVRNTNLAWFNSATITGDGTYTLDYTGNIREIHCGANNDTGFKATYESISLISTTAITALTTDDNIVLTTDSGEELTN